MESCLLNRVERFISLSEAEKRFIAFMEEDEQDASRKSVVREIGEDIDRLYVLKFGWAIARSSPYQGRSSIVRIYLPGEVIGLAEIGKGQTVYRIEMLNDGRLCPFPRHAMSRMYGEAPRLAALMTAMSSLEQLEMRYRVHGLSRLDAEDRMATFLLTLQDRLAVANHGHSRRFQLPLTQVQLGDHLGMTDIYVSRMLKRLIEDGRISYEDRHVTILDRDKWVSDLGHVDLYDEIDTSWFPEKTSSDERADSV